MRAEVRPVDKDSGAPAAARTRWANWKVCLVLTKTLVPRDHSAPLLHPEIATIDVLSVDRLAAAVAGVERAFDLQRSGKKSLLGVILSLLLGNRPYGFPRKLLLDSAI